MKTLELRRKVAARKTKQLQNKPNYHLEQTESVRVALFEWQRGKLGPTS